MLHSINAALSVAYIANYDAQMEQSHARGMCLCRHTEKPVYFSFCESQLALFTYSKLISLNLLFAERNNCPA